MFLSRVEFNKETQILSRLRDQNIVRVMGACTQDEPPALVMEYLKYGDLHQFLLSHLPESKASPTQPNVLRLVYKH